MPAPSREDAPAVGRRTDKGRANRVRLEVPLPLHTGRASCASVAKNMGPGGVFVATTRRLRAGE